MKYLTLLFICSFFIGCLPKEEGVETYQLDGGTFDVDIYVVVCESEIKAYNYISINLDSSVKQEDFNAGGVTFDQQNGNIVIWLRNTNDKSINAHELLHTNIAIMNLVNIPLKEDTEEVYAYELGYLTKQFYQKIN